MKRFLLLTCAMGLLTSFIQIDKAAAVQINDCVLPQTPLGPYGITRDALKTTCKQWFEGIPVVPGPPLNNNFNYNEKGKSFKIWFNYNPAGGGTATVTKIEPR
jgi:hypothetical protein